MLSGFDALFGHDRINCTLSIPNSKTLSFRVPEFMQRLTTVVYPFSVEAIKNTDRSQKTVKA